MRMTDEEYKRCKEFIKTEEFDRMTYDDQLELLHKLTHEKCIRLEESGNMPTFQQMYEGFLKEEASYDKSNT